MANWTAQLQDGREVKVTTEVLNRFKHLFISEQELLSRTSEVFWFDVFMHCLLFKIEPSDILDAVHNLEAGEPHNGVKPATEFKHKPLKGLWHKHYFTARFLPANILECPPFHRTCRLV